MSFGVVLHELPYFFGRNACLCFGSIPNRTAGSGFRDRFQRERPYRLDGRCQALVRGGRHHHGQDRRQASYNKFLIYEGKPLEDFDLSVQFKITKGGNSGIQFRSTHLKDKGEFVVGGYQADIATNQFQGICYEERGRGILAERSQKVVIGKDGKKTTSGSLGDPAKMFEGVDFDKFQDYRIVAKGM